MTYVNRPAQTELPRSHHDLLPTSRTNLNSKKSVTLEIDGYEVEQIIGFIK